MPVSVMAALLLLLVLALLAFTGGASIESGPDENDVYIYGESLDSQTIYVGDKDVQFYVRIRNGNSDSNPNDSPIRNCNASIGLAFGDEDGHQVQSPVKEWYTREIPDNASIYETSYYTFSYFEFDVRSNAVPMVYNVTVNMDYADTTGSIYKFVGYIHFDISRRGIVSAVNGLLPGDKGRSIDVYVDVYDGMVDPHIYVTAPQGFSWLGTSDDTVSASYEGTLYYDWSPEFTIAVEEGMTPGPHQGDYRLEYTNPDGVDCVEEGEVVLNVNPLPMLTVTTPAIIPVDQGTTTFTFTLTLTNTGNVDLSGVKITIDGVSDAYIYTIADHYEGAGTVSYSEVDVGDLEMDDSRTVEMDVLLDSYIPAGRHKVLFDLTGLYYDPIADTQRTMSTDWTSGSRGYYPLVRIPSSTIYLDPDSSSVEGTFVMLLVSSEEFPINVESSAVLSLGGRLMDNSVSIYLYNLGNVDFTNVVLQVMTNSADSPFRNPVDPDAAYSEVIRMSETMRAKRGYYLTAHLSIAPGMEPGVYSVPMRMTGINVDTGSKFETSLEARITLRGIGPRLEVTKAGPGEVRAGADFDLELEVTNTGDDTAWGVVLSVPPSFDPERGRASGVTPAVATPAPHTLPRYLGDIGPGDVVKITLPMTCSGGTEPGKVYPFHFTINCTDSYGYNPSGDELNFEVAIKTRRSPWDVLVPVIAVIVIVILIIIGVMALRRGGSGKPAREDRPSGPYMPTTQILGEGPSSSTSTPTTTYYPPTGSGGSVDEAPAPGTKTLGPTPPEGVGKGDAPGRPIYLKGDYGDSRVSISWREPLDTKEGPVIKYKVYRWAPGTDIKEIAEVTNTLEYEDTAIEAGTTYSYAVTALSSTGQSELSRTVDVRTA